MSGIRRYTKSLVVPSEYAGCRVDVALVAVCDGISRSQLHRWIAEESVSVDGRFVKASHRLHGDEQVVIDGALPPPLDWDSQNEVEFQVIYDDEHIIVVDKPAGLVVHPGTGNPDHTLVNGLLLSYPDLSNLPRAGIVHRIDKDTSGVLVVAHSEIAQRNLTKAISERTILREYQAIVEGVLDSARTIDLPIGRDQRDRTRQRITNTGRTAQTELTPLETFRQHTLIKAQLKTGRTHQIRVHSSAIGHPLLGDKRYGARGILPKSPSESTIRVLRSFNRQALHARKLVLNHPVSNKRMAYVSALPPDMRNVLDTLREDLAN